MRHRHVITGMLKQPAVLGVLATLLFVGAAPGYARVRVLIAPVWLEASWPTIGVEMQQLRITGACGFAGPKQALYFAVGMTSNHPSCLVGTATSLNQGYEAKPRHDFLDACAELTRPCLVNINSTSNHAVLRHDEPSTYGRPSIHIQGLTAIRHGRLKSALM